MRPSKLLHTDALVEVGYRAASALVLGGLLKVEMLGHGLVGRNTSTN